jgi:hypothetical protein
MTISQQTKKGDKVAYYVERTNSAGTQTIRRTGIVQGMRHGKTIVLRPAKHTELVADKDLFIID